MAEPPAVAAIPMPDVQGPKLGSICMQAAKVALVVGAILNLINQWQALLGPADLDVVKFALTFLVPFCVSTYAAYTTRRRFLAELRRVCGAV